MNFKFTKYQGACNDFIIIDDRLEKFDTSDSGLISSLCERRVGVGADGFILLRHYEGADFEMIFFNSVGLLGSLCGNGGRCIVDFAHSLKIFEDRCTFMASDGLHHAYWCQDYVSLKMSDVLEIEAIGQDSFLDTGSPHYVKEVNTLNDYNVFSEGKMIRDSDRFKADGTNVNFVEMIDDTMYIRTFERGVEDETLACGTGAVASVISMHKKYGGLSSPMKVKARGGDLSVSFTFKDNVYSNISLIGRANVAFKGELEC